MSHPLQFLPPSIFLTVFLILLTLTLVVGAALALSSRSLKPGILALEFNAIATVERWNTSDKVHAAFNTGLDFLFIVLYANLFAAGCIWGASILQAPWSSIGSALAWGQWLAAGCDMVENIALTYIIFGAKSHRAEKIAQRSAILKFTLITLGVFYIVFAGINYLL